MTDRHRPLWRRLARLAAPGMLLVTAACGGDGPGSRAPRSDVPEPATAPAATGDLPGRIVPLAGEPEGLVWDTTTGTIAAAVRNPGGVVLVDAATGAERARIPLAGTARHLQLAGPGGPLLVPSENNDVLYRLALPDGTVTAETPVGRQPHDAAPAAGGRVFVGDELADTVHVLGPDGSSRVVAAPSQPGGVASSADGSVVVVVGVRGRRIEAYAPDGRSLGATACGVGPTHVRAGAGGLFYVADTQGGAVLVFEAGPAGIRQVGQVETEGRRSLRAGGRRRPVAALRDADRHQRAAVVPHRRSPSGRRPHVVHRPPAQRRGGGRRHRPGGRGRHRRQRPAIHRSLMPDARTGA